MAHVVPISRYLVKYVLVAYGSLIREERSKGYIMGLLVWGFDLEAKNVPVIFDARRCLHASQPWDSSGAVKRVVLIAWTVIHIRTMPESLRQELQELGFPVPTLTDLSADVPDSWVPVASPTSKRVKLTQPCLSFSQCDAPGLSLQGNVVLHHLD